MNISLRADDIANLMSDTLHGGQKCSRLLQGSYDTVEDPAKALLAEQDPAKALAEKEADGNDPQLQLEMVSLRCHCVFLLGTWEDWRLRCVILIWI